MAYPVFAFMLVEGYFHTHNLRRYFLRLFLFAVASEIPFDYMYGGTAFYPYHQNVMWTFLIALSGITIIDRVRHKQKIWIIIPISFLIGLTGFLLGYATMVDYYGIGVLTVFLFYFFRGKEWWCYAGQILGMYILNVSILGGYYYPVTVFGMEIELVQQSIALLSLIPIWLYQGRQGYHSKFFQYFCYAFYPLHILILVVIGVVMGY